MQFDTACNYPKGNVIDYNYQESKNGLLEITKMK